MAGSENTSGTGEGAGAMAPVPAPQAPQPHVVREKLRHLDLQLAGLTD